MDKQTNNSAGNGRLSSAEQQLKAANQQLRASEQQLRAANQQLGATVQQLRVSEERYALAQRAANIGTWESNLKTGEVTWAGQTHALFGFAPDEFKGTREAFYELVHPDDRQYVAEAVERCRKECKPYRFEHRIVRADGKVCWISEMADVFRDQKDEPARLVGITVDITKRREAEDALKAANQQLEATNQQLRASEQQLKAANQQLEASNQQLIASEKQVREETERRRRYFDVAGAIMIVINPEAKVELVNRRGCETLGYSEEEILGRNWFDSFLPESVREKTRATFEQLMAGETELMEYNENLVLTKSGEERITNWHNAIITDEDGNIIEVLASGMDITDRRRAEEALARSESIYRKTIENAQGVPYQLRFSDGKYIFMGSGVEELVGIAVEELTQESLDKIVKETIISDLCGYESLEAYCSAFEGGKLDRFQADVCVQTPQGEIKWFSDCSLAIRDEETGETTGCIGVLQEITKRKHTEAALAEQYNVLRTLIDNLPDSVYVKNVESEFVVGNTVTADIMGVAGSEELVGKSDLDFLPREMALKYRADEQEIFRSGQALVNREEPVVNQTTGETIWHLTSKVPLHDSIGEIVGLVGIGRNITERKEAQEALKAANQQLEATNQQLRANEQQLKAANQQLEASEQELRAANQQLHASQQQLKAANQQLQASEKELQSLVSELEVKNTELERFTYAVSHDLKSPLITIKGFLGMLERDAAAGDIERMHGDMERISNAAENMSQQLDELLELSRVGRLVKAPAKVSLEELTREAVELVMGRISERNVQIGISPDMPVVFGDHARLLNVFQNLIDNAVKFMGEQAEPCIEIGVRQDGEETVCYVKDNGIGINPDYQEKIFGLFDKLDRESEGTGVGLALVKRIVEVHGGRIWVESEGLEKGSTFCFTIPTG